MTHPPRAASAKEYADFVTVQTALSSPRIEQLRTTILAGQATNQEIEEQYRAHDALDAQTGFEDVGSAAAYRKTLGRIALVDFMGGAQMVTSTLLGSVLEANHGYVGIIPALTDETLQTLAQYQLSTGNIEPEDADTWNEINDYLDSATEDGPLLHLADRVGLLQYALLTGFLDTDVRATTEESLKALSLGRAIMREGAKGYGHFLHEQPTESELAGDDLQMAKKLVGIAEDPRIQFGLSDLIIRSGESLDSKEAKDIVLCELKEALGPIFAWPTVIQPGTSIRYEGAYQSLDAENIRTMQELGFTNALHVIERMVTYAKETDATMFQKGRIKGSLHEVLWMLDAFAVRKGMPDAFGSWAVDVATEAEDMPFVGKPTMRRGFDFVIRDSLGGNTRRFIQIGASLQKAKNRIGPSYNPQIELYCERQFNEVNLPTLAKRVSDYLQWAEGGFDPDKFEQDLKDSLLDTVRDCFGINIEQQVAPTEESNMPELQPPLEQHNPDVIDAIYSMELYMGIPKYNNAMTPSQLAIDCMNKGYLQSFAEFEDHLRTAGSRVHFIAVPLDYFGDAYETTFPLGHEGQPEYSLYVAVNGAEEAIAMLDKLGITAEDNHTRLETTGMLVVPNSPR